MPQSSTVTIFDARSNDSTVAPFPIGSCQVGDGCGGNANPSDNGINGDWFLPCLGTAQIGLGNCLGDGQTHLFCHKYTISQALSTRKENLGALFLVYNALIPAFN